MVRRVGRPSQDWTKMTRLEGEAGGVHAYIRGEYIVRALLGIKVNSDHRDLEMRVDEVIIDKSRAYIVIEIRKKSEIEP